MKKQPYLSLYLDATGSVVKKMDGMKKRPYYYALSLAGILSYDNYIYIFIVKQVFDNLEHFMCLLYHKN